MQATLGELALLVDGQAVGPEDLPIHGAAILRDALAGEITLADSADRGRTLAESRAAAVVCPRSFAPNGTPAILVDDARAAFARIVLHFRPARVAKRIGVSRMSAISSSAVLGASVDVHPFATIGDEVTIGAGSTIHSGAHVMAGCRIGEDVTIFPGAVLYENTIVGDRTIIHAAAVLGAYGFGYDLVDGRHRLSAQLGNVVVGADVEIGAGTTIDRGTYGPTVIGDGTKIDDQVMIAHNCHIGRHNLICSHVGIAGSTSTGDYVMMAGRVGIRDHVRIGDRAVLGAMAGVISDVPPDARMVGIPATPEHEQMLKQAALAKLPEMRKQLKAMQATIDKLAAQLEARKRAEAVRASPEEWATD
jgi:UDP-3-O-[3-hydroxymyristoyl] glucosamine N-acyltransferase